MVDEDEIIALTDHKKKLKYTKSSKTNAVMKKVKEEMSEEKENAEKAAPEKEGTEVDDTEHNDAFWL